MSKSEPGRCPDGGTCHGSTIALGSAPCVLPYCYRVLHAGPLSGVYPDDAWPAGVYSAARNRPVDDDPFDPDGGDPPRMVPENDNSPVYLRDGGRCAYGILHVCLRGAHSVDHRIHGKRSNRWASNLITACGDGTRGCHGWKEAHPERAAAFGWTLPSTYTVDPATVPVFLRHAIWGTGWFLLDDRLGLTPTTAPDERQP